MGIELEQNYRVLSNGVRQRVWSIASIAEAKMKILNLMEAGFGYLESLRKLDIPCKTVFFWRQNDLMFDKSCSNYTSVKVPTVRKKTVKAGINGMPKKTEFTQEEAVDAKKEFLNGLRLGLPVDYALMLCSATRETLRKWMAAEESFMLEVNKAQAQNLAWWIQKIRTGAESDWRAALAYLERVFPHLFAEVKQVEITQKRDKDADIININKENERKEQEQKRNTIRALSDEELLALAMKGSSMSDRGKALVNNMNKKINL